MRQRRASARVGPLGPGKRLVDVVGSTALLIVTSPVIAAVALAIRLSDGSPVLFRQRRPGRDEEVFTMYKFRTMRAPRSGEETYTTDAQRVTRVGAFLRRTSLDELPELVNVVKGEMSLVGPRPLLIEYLPNYSPEHRRRHLVRPGVTGLAQVSGRRTLTFSQRLDLDVQYVDSWSPGLDVRILLKTLAAPFISSPGESQSLDSVDDLGLMKAQLMRDPGVGSFFPYPAAEPHAAGPVSDAPADWPPDSWLLVNSGRAALTTIVLAHLRDHPKARLWMPSYYCWDVTHYIAQWIPVVTYPSRPPVAPLPAEIPGDDLLLVISYFGARPQRSTAPSHQVILDVTHDPLAEWVPDYGAGWLFGSLRKSLPLPEGGFAYSSLRSAAHLEATHPTVESRRIVARSRGHDRETPVD